MQKSLAEPPPSPPPPPSTAAPPPEAQKLGDMAAAAAARGSLQTLLRAAELTQLLEELNAGGPFTVFAPTDTAFEKLGAGESDRLMTNSGKLKELLLYHTLRGRVSIAEALKQGKMKTILGPAVQFQQAGEEVFVNSAAVIERDIECTNGVLHLIDRVLVPPGFEFPREGSGQAGSPR